MVECQPSKLNVEGSSPFSRFMAKEKDHKRKVLTAQIAQEVGLKRQDVVKVVARFLDLLKVELINEKQVNLKNFGTLYKAKLSARKIHCGNGKVKTIIDFPERTTIRFKPSKLLRDSLNS